jgi:hypothetical protein
MKLKATGYLHDWFMFYIVGHLCNIWAINLTIDWCFTSADLLYLLSPCYASWHIGQGQGSSTLLCCWLFFLLCPRCILSFISFSMVHLLWHKVYMRFIAQLLGFFFFKTILLNQIFFYTYVKQNILLWPMLNCDLDLWPVTFKMGFKALYEISVD